MHNFLNILYVSQGEIDQVDGLKQALSLARNNNAVLKFLIMCPVLPKDMLSYKKKYEEVLLAQAHVLLTSTLKDLKIPEDELDISIELESNKHPVISIIQHVLKNGNDLIIKEFEPHSGGSGFKAIDMELLRKCPCPVWICRPIIHHRNEIQVAVAIDPDANEVSEQILSKRMLLLSRSLSDSCSKELHIISCWDGDLEENLYKNPFLNMSDDTRLKTLLLSQKRHKGALEDLIKQSKITGVYHVHHLRGNTEESISRFVSENNIDILVMGTIGRTGIHGFIFGNTAENIIQKLPCSLLALKPPGFVTPVKI